MFGLGFLGIVWPFVRAAFVAVLRPFLDPLNWIGLAALGFAAFGYGWWKGDAHGDRQCAARIQHERLAQDKAVKDTGKETQTKIDALNTELDERDVQIAILDAETDADSTAGSCSMSLNGVRRVNRGRAR